MWQDNSGQLGDVELTATCENDDGWFITVSSSDNAIELFTEDIEVAIELRDALTRAIDKFEEVTA